MARELSVRLGRLPGLSASEASESVSTISIDLFAPLVACFTFFRLLYAHSATWLVAARRSSACGASRRSAIAEVERPAEASCFFFLVTLFLAFFLLLLYLSF